MKYKKLSVLIWTILCTAVLNIYSQQEIVPLQGEDSSGLDKIVRIMGQIHHDVVPGFDGTIEYASVANLAQDLNLQEIVKTFRCKTTMGSAYLYEILQKPVSPTDTSGIVELRQAFIRKLVQDQEFKAQVEELLEVVAKYEKDVIELFSDTFRAKVCGSDLQTLEVIQKQHSLFYPLFKLGTYNTAYRTANMALSVVMLGGMGVGTYVWGKMAMQNAKAGLPFGSLSFLTAYYALFAGMITYELYNDFTKAGIKRGKMHALNQLINTASLIEALNEKNEIATQFKISLISDKEGVALIKGLKASRYKAKTDYCFHVPAVHTFLYYLYENEASFAQVFASLAEVDAYNAIADKILTSQNTARRFCFTEKLDHQDPTIITQGFWNVLVPGKAVPNAVDFNHSMILTGPNAGGKTTAIRAILQNLLLAQTYGVAAAESFAYTPFDIILSYLNISDDLLQGYSLFASEVKRAKELLEVIKGLAPQQKMFFALDELFTGTAAENGEKCAYEFIKRVAGFDRLLFVYATHFDKLKELGNEESALMNYQVNAPIKNKLGRLVYPYTLSPGASTVNVALDMAKEANLFD